MNSSNIQDRPVALVTGGARRIGAAIIKALHDHGYAVVIHCRNSRKEAEALAQTVPPALVVQYDLTHADAASTLVNEINHWAGRLDVVVNNASEFITSDLEPASTAAFDRLFHTNVLAPFNLSMAARALLAARHGVIINITDIHGKAPLKHYSLYSQTKAALEMQTRSLARELAPDIRVNAVAPGAIAWPEHDNAVSEAVKKQIVDSTPLKRHGTPEYIAAAVVSLITNPFITGQTLAVDGGRSCYL